MYATGLTAELAAGRGTSRVGPNWKLLAMAGAIAFALCASAPAADATITRIEEEWEIIVGTPDPSTHAPQLINAMSTTDKLSDVHAVFEVNHKTQPSYEPGRLQLQCWSGDTLLGYSSSTRTGQLNTPGEVITYTITMALDNASGKVNFFVRGQGPTWTNFGSSDHLTLHIGTPQTFFPNYSPEVSVKNSKVTFAAHTIQKFAQKKVRYYTAAGALVHEDTTERVVHQLPSGS